MLTKLKSSLKFKMTLLLLGSALLIGLITVISAYFILYQQISQQATRQVEEVFDAVEYSSAIAAYSGNEEIASDVVRGVIRSQFVSDVALHNHEKLHAVLYKFADRRTFQSKIKRTLKSPFDADEIVGSLEISLYEPEIAARATRAALLLAAGLGLMVLVLAAFIWFAISRLITNPLFALSQKLHNIQPGTPERLTSNLYRKDELGLVTKDINTLLEMAESTLSEERALRAHIEALEKQYQSVFEHARTGIALLDIHGKCILANPIVGQIIGLDEITVDGPFSLLDHWFNEVFEHPESFTDMLETSIATGIPLSKDFRLKSPFDPQKANWINITMAKHPSEDELVLIECMFFDISERKSREDETLYLAHHDPLTRLRNRRAAEAWVVEHVKMPQANGYLILMDLDRFKHINDTWGHDAGDAVLIEVARRMRALVRADRDLIARLGGDEFLICLNEFSDKQALHVFLTKFIQEIGRYIDLGNGQVDFVGASLGVVKYPEQATDITQLLNIADTGMYEAKNAGRNGYSIYNGRSFDTVNLPLRDALNH